MLGSDLILLHFLEQDFCLLGGAPDLLLDTGHKYGANACEDDPSLGYFCL